MGAIIRAEKDPFYYNTDWCQRKLSKDLIERLKDFTWFPMKSYICYDHKFNRICIFIPELVLENEMFHYIEVPFVEPGAPLEYNNIVKDIISTTKNNGRKYKASYL